MMATMTLTEFLLARIAEDQWAAANLSTYAPTDLARVGADPNRMLAECKAKRDLVEVFTKEIWCLGVQTPVRRVETFEGRAVLRILADVYADHPDYNEDWRR